MGYIWGIATRVVQWFRKSLPSQQMPNLCREVRVEMQESEKALQKSELGFSYE